MELPAELRLMIYDYSFSSNHAEGKEIETTKPIGPRYNLLATCHQVLEEAQAAYEIALKLFLGKSYRYRATIDHEKSLSWTEPGQVIRQYAGSKRLPPASGLAVRFRCPSKDFGRRSFTIRLRLSSKGTAIACLRSHKNCNSTTIEELQKAISTLMRRFTFRRDMVRNGALHIGTCLSRVWAMLDKVSGEEGPAEFWEEMELEDDKGSEYES